MRVLLVQGYLGPSHADGLVYPLGLAYLGTVLEQRGHEVRLVDPNVLPSPLEGLQQAIREYSPAFIGLSLRNIDSLDRSAIQYYFRYFRDTLMAIQSVVPDALPLAVGGAGFSIFSKTIMERLSRIDFGLTLEAEESFPELLEHLEQPELVLGVYYRSAGSILYSGDHILPDFANLPQPRRDFLDLEPYRKVPYSMGVQTKRGCSLKCAYCNYPFLNGQRFRLRRVEDICDELEYLVGLGFASFTFADSMFNVPPRHADRLLTEMVRRKIPLKWGCYMHIKGVDYDFIRLAQESGADALLFSPDGVSQRAMDLLQKNTTEDDLNKLVELLSTHKEFAALHLGFTFFVNPPGENWSGLMKTLAFYVKLLLLRLRPGGAGFRPYPGWIRLEPHTSVYERALSEGAISLDKDLLPIHDRELDSTFYRHPRLGWIDWYLVKLFQMEYRVVRWIKLVQVKWRGSV